MKTILFQGDSITDADRSRNNDENRGLGYPHLVTAKMGLASPGAYRFFNRGISGNRVVDLYARIKCDFINLKPDYCSILIGINDVWHEIYDHNGVDAQKYEKIYSMLLEEILDACPQIKLLIMEPFVLPGRATTEHFSYFQAETEKRAEAAARVATQFQQTFVPLQDVLNKALDKAPAEYWLADGVHPTVYGHELITQEWIKAFNSIH